MTLIPYGVDSITGIPRPAAADEGLVGASAIPTPVAYTYNTETLTGTKILTDSSETLQFLSTGGADRFVDLPIPTTNTPLFLIVNMDTSSFVLKVRSNEQIVQREITAGNAVRVWTNGTSVIVGEETVVFNLRFQGKASYSWGGTPSLSNTPLATNGEGGSSVGSSFDYLSEHTIGGAGTLDEIFFHTGGGSGDIFRVFKNGVLDTTLPAIPVGLVGSFTTSISVVAGDQIAIERAAASGGDKTIMTALVTSSTGHVTYSWGGFGILGYFFEANGVAGETLQTVEDASTKHVILQDCTGISLSWNSQSAVLNTDYEIWKNGAQDTIVNATGATTGSVSLATPNYSAGDTLSIKNTGSSTGLGTVILLCSGSSGVSYRFGGTAGASADLFYQLNGVYNRPATADGTSEDVQLTTPECIIDRMSISRGASTASDAFQLYKNGAASTTSSPTTAVATEILTFTDTPFAKDDLMAVATSTTINSSTTIINILLKVI